MLNSDQETCSGIHLMLHVATIIHSITYQTLMSAHLVMEAVLTHVPTQWEVIGVDVSLGLA